jgi:hypothetical protein
VVDTDGAEVDVLRGAGNLLKSVSCLVIGQHYGWEKGEWHKRISSLCLSNGYFWTLSRPNHTKDYEDVLWTRSSMARIQVSKIFDLLFLFKTAQTYHM